MAVASRRHGAANDKAQLRKPLSLDEYMGLPMMVAPFCRDDCALVSDGGAALIVCSLEYARKIGKANAPRIAAISTVTPTFASESVEMPDLANDSAVAAEAYRFRAALPQEAHDRLRGGKIAG